ncbi:hypothetical protein [Desulfogranum marinum]|uniref:hypothetical protein n=1 Tax=Desulfogranum marinum TaxID=453220 RepID=UPI0019633E09|nr:hypothetical protein [Desulfogranum marinum]MBM9513903.1 hypothetical protein [Desulfogranum marinum]
MEKLVADLKEILPFKQTTGVGDVVIVVAKEPQLLTYAMISKIERDDTRKNEWWHVTMQFLTIPLQEVTWTLRTPQFTGQEIFTMGGEGRFIQAVDFNFEDEAVQPEPIKGSTPIPMKKGIRRIK